MSAIDFDVVLQHIGEKGRYQNVMYYLLCIPATIPAAFLAFSQVFVSASPDHWCRVPELEDSLLSPETQKEVAIPKIVREDGRIQFSKCEMYDVNFTDYFDRTGGWPLTPDPNWTVTKCRFGWNYDKKDYDSTLVTEVSVIKYT